MPKLETQIKSALLGHVIGPAVLRVLPEQAASKDERLGHCLAGAIVFDQLLRGPISSSPSSFRHCTKISISGPVGGLYVGMNCTGVPGSAPKATRAA